MKSIVLSAVFIFSISIFISCKKDGSGGSSQPKETLLSEARVNGMTSMKINYNSDRLPAKLESYSIDPANPKMVQYLDFKYNAEGKITEVTSFEMPANQPVSKSVFEYDANGKLAKGYAYDLQSIDPNTPYITSTFTCNDKNLVTKIVDKDKSGKSLYQRNLSYFEDGRTKEHQLWQPNGDMLWMSGKVTYSSPSGSYPAGLDQLRSIIGGDMFGILYSDVVVELKYSKVGVITNHIKEQMSNREFDEEGFLIKQTVTRDIIVPAVEGEVLAMELKYIKK